MKVTLRTDDSHDEFELTQVVPDVHPAQHLYPPHATLKQVHGFDKIHRIRAVIDASSKSVDPEGQRCISVNLYCFGSKTPSEVEEIVPRVSFYATEFAEALKELLAWSMSIDFDNQLHPTETQS